MNQLNIFELQNSVHRKKEIRISVFQSILVKCHTKITEAAKNELYLCHYHVPEYVMGLPLYNISDCTKYIMTQLQENGFTVEHVYHKCLIISWFPTNTIGEEIEDKDNSLYLNYIPYKNTKGKFILNVD
jgi:hypothetical protein